MLANVDHGREQCLYLLFDNSLNCCVHFERYYTMFLLCKVVFILVLLGCVSEMLSVPVKLRDTVVSDAVEDAKAVRNDDKEVRLKSEYIDS